MRPCSFASGLILPGLIFRCLLICCALAPAAAMAQANDGADTVPPTPPEAGIPGNTTPGSTPNAQSTPEDFSSPNNAKTPNAFRTPNAASTPNAAGTPEAPSIANTLTTPGAVTTPNANFAPSEISIPRPTVPAPPAVEAPAAPAAPRPLSYNGLTNGGTIAPHPGCAPNAARACAGFDPNAGAEAQKRTGQ